MSKRENIREGKVLVFVAFILVVLLGMVALAVDLGWIFMAKAQLQSSSDAGSLAGGTELLAGLGANKTSEPNEVKTDAGKRAVEYVALHRAGESGTTYIEAARDVKLGKATLNTKTNAWSFEWDETPYNAVGVTTRRSDDGKNAGDGPLPLFFARVLGHNFSNVTADSVAVIMPASTIRLVPGSGSKSQLSPFAFEEARWKKYIRAIEYYKGLTGSSEENPSTISVGGGGTEIWDTVDDSPLFYEIEMQGSKEVYRQLFDDKFSYSGTAVQKVPDGKLEVNIYPLNNEPGNYGTVDIGGLDNSTAVLKRQILEGINSKDLGKYANGELPMPTKLQGDTGISSGIEAALTDILGEERAILLYKTVSEPGNNAMYEIVTMVGTRFMAVDLSGKFKVLVLQIENISLGGGVPDFETGISDETTVFTPLILAE